MAADSPGVTTDDHDDVGDGGASAPATSDDRDAGEPSQRSGPAETSPESPTKSSSEVSSEADGIPDPPVLTSPPAGRRSLRGSAKVSRVSTPGGSAATGAGGLATGSDAGSSAGGASTDPTAVSPAADPTVQGPQVGGRPGSAPAAPAGPAPLGPEAPVPAGAGGPPAHIRRAGRRIAARRQDRATRRGLRIDQRLWSISPWSVFKVSALFYFCMALIVLVAGTLLYNAGRSVGTIDELESFVTRMGAYGECTAVADVPEDTEFREDEKCGEGEVLIGGFTLDDGVLFRAVLIGGAILVVAGTIGNVLMVVLLNLLNELTGGIRHTVIREPSGRSPADGPPRAAAPAATGPGGARHSAPRRPGGLPTVVPSGSPTGSPPPDQQH